MKKYRLLFLAKCPHGFSVDVCRKDESYTVSITYMGRFLDWSNTLHKYSPRTPKIIICIPPVKVIIIIKALQPCIGILPLHQLYATIAPYTSDANVKIKPKPD